MKKQNISVKQEQKKVNPQEDKHLKGQKMDPYQ